MFKQSINYLMLSILTSGFRTVIKLNVMDLEINTTYEIFKANISIVYTPLLSMAFAPGALKLIEADLRSQRKLSI